MSVVRIALFTILGLGIVGGAAAAWLLLAAPPAPPAVAVAAPVRAAVLAAAHPLRAGSLVKPDDLAAFDMAIADIPPGASTDTPQARGKLVGALIRRSLGENQPILPADVVHPGDHGFLAAVLGPNMRAVTVAVDAVSGTAGLIWPGDRVDLILTQAMEDTSLAVGHRVAAETVLADARVIAVDQQIIQGQAPASDANAPVNRTATLEVTAAQAERVLVAGRLGKLSLSVRSADRQADARVSPAPASPANASPVGAGAPSLPVPPLSVAAVARPASGAVTWAGDVSPALGNDATRTAPVKVQVFQGDTDIKEFHF